MPSQKVTPAMSSPESLARSFIQWDWTLAAGAEKVEWDREEGRQEAGMGITRWPRKKTRQVWEVEIKGSRELLPRLARSLWEASVG